MAVRIVSAGLIAHPNKDGVLPVAARLVDACDAAGIALTAEPWLAEAMGDARVAPKENVAQGADVLIVLGGDGTLLRAVPIAVRHDLPLCGINLGRVGFLTEVEPGEDPAAIPAAMRALADGDYQLERRMLLTVTPPDGQTMLALNDAVISRGAHGRVITLEASLNGQRIDRYIADGLVVSTPTGSTAYSLSAGGPVVAPDVPCLVLAPICPHTLRARPMILPADGTVRLTVRDVPEGERAILTVDGQHAVKLSAGEAVTVARATQVVSFIRLKRPDFFDLLRVKLTEWSR